MNNLANFCTLFLPVCIFLIWLVFGYATLNLLFTRTNTIKNLLLAPTIGAAVTTVSVFLFNYSGIPVGAFSKQLTCALLLISIIALKYCKAIFPVKRYLPFFCVFILTLFLVGKPLLYFGLDWISYSNGDMTNYCLAANRFLHYGYFDIPDINKLLTGTDYSLHYWFMYIPGASRSGSELILAWVSGITNLSTVQIFMPTILALNMTLISASAAMLYVSRKWYQPAFVLCILLSFSALTTLGVLYQLIAQVGGLSLLICSAIILLQHSARDIRHPVLKSSGLLIILASAILIYYPEIIPFLGLSFLAYYLVNILRGWCPGKNIWLMIGLAALITPLLLRKYFIFSISFLLEQITHGTHISSTNAVIFPYYLLPGGLANLWGIFAIGNYPPEPRLSISILLGGILLVFSIIAAALVVIREKFLIPAYFTLVMFGLGMYLFICQADFGLFKLAMYIQPFLLATIAIFLYIQITNKTIRMMVITALVLIGVPTQQFYISRSEAREPGPLSEITYASSSKISKEYSRLLADIPSNSLIITNDFNSSLLKMLALNSKKMRLAFCSYPIFRDFDNNNMNTLNLLPSFSDTAERILTQLKPLYKTEYFDLHTSGTNNTNAFEKTVLCDEKQKDAFILIDTPRRGILNRFKFDDSITNNFIIVPANDARNILSFINSMHGPIFFAEGHSQPATFFNIESDWFYPQSIMQSIGRHLLFKIINPAPRIRFVLNFTASLNHDSNNSLPATVIIGSKRISLPMTGRGSARVFSEPFSPQVIDNSYYAALDFQTENIMQSSQHKSFMNFYGKNILVDSRKIIGFGRDMSIISEEEYNRLDIPSMIKDIHKDLTNKNIEYSGIYEDGYASEHAFIVLNQPAPSSRLIIKGSLNASPDGPPANSQLSILIDGKKIRQLTFLTNDFNLSIPIISAQTGRKKIELLFNQLQHRPHGDDRPVSAVIDYIGFSK